MLVNHKDLPEVYKKRAEMLANRKQLTEKKVSKALMLVFSLGNKGKYAIEIVHILEIQPFTRCTPVPMSSDLIKGVINFRSEIRCVLDLSRLIDLKDSSDEDSGYILILKENETGLKISQIDRIYQISEDEMITFKDQPVDFGNDYAKGILNKEIVWLDVDKILKHPVLSVRINL